MKTKITWFDKVMAAVTFAEANEPDLGKEFLSGTARKPGKEQISKERDDILATDLHGAEVHS